MDSKTIIFRSKNTFGDASARAAEAQEIMHSGHLACPGCAAMPMIRLFLKVFGKRTMIVAPACCYVVVDGPFPYSASGVPLMHCAFESAAATASGVRAALDMRGIDDVQVVAIAGDGGTFDIGLQALSAAAERNENILYICYDNEAYMNTGIQRSSATPWGAWTTTTPGTTPKAEAKKHMGAIMAAHKIPYFATASLSHPEDLITKFTRAKQMHGFRMIHYLSPCPTGWKADSRDMVKLARLAVQTRVFPLYEVFEGERWVVNVEPEPPARLDDYLKLQGRFKHLNEQQVESIKTSIEKEWTLLQEMARKSSGPNVRVH